MKLIKRLYILVIFLCLISTAYAGGNFYFADDGAGDIVGTCDDGVECTEATPCDTLAEAQACVDDNTGVVYLNFKRDDQWDINTVAVSLSVQGLEVTASDPVIHIDAYDSGAKPIFDGGVADFSTAPVHNGTTGPAFWTPMFRIMSNGSSIKNVKFNGSYGGALAFGTTGGADHGDQITVEGCDFTNIGYAGIVASGLWGTVGSTITKNLFIGWGLLWDAGKTPGNNWSFAVSTAPVYGQSRSASGNIISYNVLYNGYGEGIHGNGSTVEYNIVGDTGSVGIYCNPFAQNATNHIIRYNLVVSSDSSNPYTTKAGVTNDGIIINDENNGVSGGSNAFATVEVYGNIVINRTNGIKFNDNDDNSPWGEIRIYNNTVIDSVVKNFYIQDFQTVAANKGFVYNNASILYDRTGALHCGDNGTGTLTDYWTISHNAFWDATAGGGGTIDSDWITSYQITNPLLHGEEDGSPINWDGITSGVDPSTVVDFADIYPDAESSLIANGLALPDFDENLLTTGTIFNGLPSGGTFVLKAQSLYNKREIGAALLLTGGFTGGNLVPTFYTNSETGNLIPLFYTNSGTGNLVPVFYGE